MRWLYKAIIVAALGLSVASCQNIRLSCLEQKLQAPNQSNLITISTEISPVQGGSRTIFQNYVHPGDCLDLNSSYLP